MDDKLTGALNASLNYVSIVSDSITDKEETVAKSDGSSEGEEGKYFVADRANSSSSDEEPLSLKARWCSGRGIKNSCKKLRKLSLVKKDTGGLHFNGGYSYASMTGVTISIFLVIVIICILVRGMSSIGEY